MLFDYNFQEFQPLDKYMLNRIFTANLSCALEVMCLANQISTMNSATGWSWTITYVLSLESWKPERDLSLGIRMLDFRPGLDSYESCKFSNFLYMDWFAKLFV